MTANEVEDIMDLSYPKVSIECRDRQIRQTLNQAKKLLNPYDKRDRMVMDLINGTKKLLLDKRQ